MTKKIMSKFIYTTALDKIRKMKKRIKVIPGGTSAGKTFSILPILIDKCIKEPNLEVSVISETMPHLRKGAIKDFLSILKMTNRYIDKNWNRSNFKYTFSNDSYIEFFSADNGDRLRGPRRNVLYVNECNNINREAYTQLAMRTSADIYLDYNPTNKFWVEEVLESEEAEKLVLTYRDNEALPQTIIDFLESKRELAKTSDYWRNWCDVYLDGKSGKIEGLIFKDYKVLDKLPDEARLLGLGLDFGFTNDPTSIVELYKWNDEIIYNEICYRTGMLNKDISDLLKGKGIKDSIYCDSAEPKSIAELKRLGHRALPVTKGKDSIMFGVNLMNQYKINITKSSKNLLKEFDSYEYKKDKEGNTINEPIDNWNHAIDAARYITMMKLYRNKVRKQF